MDGMNNTNKTIELEKKITPKYIAQKCPVCNGFGTLKFGEKVCNACNGKCYVLVPNFQVKEQNEAQLY